MHQWFNKKTHRKPPFKDVLKDNTNLCIDVWTNSLQTIICSYVSFNRIGFETSELIYQFCNKNQSL